MYNGHTTSLYMCVCVYASMWEYVCVYVCVCVYVFLSGTAQEAALTHVTLYGYKKVAPWTERGGSLELAFG